MSGYPILSALSAWSTRLEGLLPEFQKQKVPVFPGMPGNNHGFKTLVWFEDIIDLATVTGMRAVERHRVLETEMTCAIGCLYEGKGSGIERQSEADRRVASILSIIDYDIRTEAKMGAPELIDLVRLDRIEWDRGLTDTGAGTRASLTLTVHARFLGDGQ